MDTILYLYYDADHADNSTYVGVPNSVVAESVWDANFVLVDHMKDGAGNNSTYDSTSNDNDGTKDGANTPEEEADGKTGYAQDFEAEAIDYGSAASLENMTARTVEFIARIGGFTGAYRGFFDGSYFTADFGDGGK